MTDLSFLPLTVAVLFIGSLLALFVFACAREWQLWRYSTRPNEVTALRTRKAQPEDRINERKLRRLCEPHAINPLTTTGRSRESRPSF